MFYDLFGDTYVPFDFYSQNAWNRSSYNGIRLVKKIESDNSGEIFYKREKLRNFYENFRTTDKEWDLIESLLVFLFCKKFHQNYQTQFF